MGCSSHSPQGQNALRFTPHLQALAGTHRHDRRLFRCTASCMGHVHFLEYQHLVATLPPPTDMCNEHPYEVQTPCTSGVPFGRCHPVSFKVTASHQWCVWHHMIVLNVLWFNSIVVEPLRLSYFHTSHDSCLVFNDDVVHTCRYIYHIFGFLMYVQRDSVARDGETC